MPLKIETLTEDRLPPILLEHHTKRAFRPEYDEIAEHLLNTKPGEWCRILLSDLPKPRNSTSSGKITHRNIVSAMKARKVGKIRTRVMGMHIWISVVREA